MSLLLQRNLVPEAPTVLDNLITSFGITVTQPRQPRRPNPLRKTFAQIIEEESGKELVRFEPLPADLKTKLLQGKRSVKEYKLKNG